jgi:galactokinase
MVDPAHTVAEFRSRFGDAEGVCVFRAPGRVNLIGEHTDYNDGFVLPVAIDRDIVVVCRRRSDERINVYSTNIQEDASFTLDDIARERVQVPKWACYILGVASVLAEGGAKLCGVDAVLESDVPVGAGLSSSAALEISSGFALLRVSGVPIDRLELALAGQRAEHEFVGTQCGIMDQYVATMGVHDAALLIDCRTLKSVSIPIDTTETSIVICNSGVKHDLATSAYNERRKECESAVETLKTVLPDIRALRDVSIEQLHEHQKLLAPVVLRRARHVVTENDRTLQAADALRNGNMADMGRLMYASHTSLSEDYEVSVAELDILVDETLKIPSVYGARMTGGGFGGCTVNLVKREGVHEFEERMTRAYKNATGRSLQIYVCEVVNGVEEVSL